MPFFKKSERGMTLIELLIVVAIIGVLSAIATVNYLVALDKSKQKKTMADIRSIANAWEARAIDFGGYSAAGAEDVAFVWPSEAVTGDELYNLLNPTYLRPMPRTDGWENPIGLAIDTSDEDSSVYAIRSAGKDGLFETSYPSKLTDQFECDIVFSSGTFVVSPANK